MDPERDERLDRPDGEHPPYPPAPPPGAAEDRLPAAGEVGPARPRARALVALLIVATAGLGLWVTLRYGQQDSALLFVGLPALLALATLVAPVRTLQGLTFKVLTIGLLVVATVLREGAICILLAAPLVYLVGAGVAGLLRLAQSEHRRGALVLVPILLVASAEGTAPGLRAVPDRTATVQRTVALRPDEVAARMAAGPAFSPRPRPLLLRLGYPVPGAVSGDGVDPGDRWRFAVRDGAIVTEVTGNEVTGSQVTGNAAPAGGRVVDFRVVSDTSTFARWLSWRSARLSWRPDGAGGTVVRLDIGYRRGLDPSWYFGPIEHAFVTAGVQAMLDGLGLTPAGQ